MFSGISIVCFTASYTVTLLLEIVRLRGPVQNVLRSAFGIGGFIAHTIYLANEANNNPVTALPLSSWYCWCLMAAWVMAAAYLLVIWWRPKTAVGLFIMPPVLLLVGTTFFLSKDDYFATNHAYRAWGMIHGIALLLGTVSVAIGFASGTMYLIQSHRLKQKLPPSRSFRLPSLEWLQGLNEGTLVLSSMLLGIGLLAGILMNLSVVDVHKNRAIPWSDPAIVTSLALVIWLLALSLFVCLYKPARHGRKVAYLTVASFILLGAVLCMVVFSPTDHTKSKPIGSSVSLLVEEAGE